MRVKNAMIVLAVAVVCGAATRAHALDLDFVLVNSTGWSIKEIYISPSASDEWGDNILTASLKDGQELKLTFHPKATAAKWDLKIVWKDGGDAVVWHGYKLTDIEKITLEYDEDTKKTTAKTE